MVHVLSLQRLAFEQPDEEGFFNSTQSICCNGSTHSQSNCCNATVTLF